MTRLPKLTPADLNEDQKALYDALVEAVGSRHSGAFQLVQSDGSLAASFNLWIHNPPIGRGLSRLGGVLRTSTCLPHRLREMVILVVAAGEGSEFEWNAHSAQASVLGVSDEDLARIQRRERPAVADDLEAAVVDAAIELTKTGTLSLDTYGQCVTHIGWSGVVELTTLIGFYQMVALQHRVFDITSA